VAADRAQEGLLMAPAFRAAAMCKLGRKERARQDLEHFYAIVRAAWTGELPSTEAMIARWLLHLYPVSRAEIRHRLHDGMALAGLPVEAFSDHG
jgi:hypothetical protein